MKTRIAMLLMLPLYALAVPPAPLPVTIDSRAGVSPALTAYRGETRTFRVSFRDGAAASDLTGCVPFMSWAYSTAAAGVSTASWAVVGSATNGVIDFTFSAAALNTNGNMIYECGARDTNNALGIYRQGALAIIGSPTGAGAGPLTLVTPVNWDTVQNVGTVPWSASGISASQATNIAAALVAPAYTASTNAQATADAAYPSSNPSNYAVAFGTFNTVAGAEALTYLGGAVALSYDGTTFYISDPYAFASALSLGSAAYVGADSFATAAQGANADTAYGWGNHAGLYASAAQGSSALSTGATAYAYATAVGATQATVRTQLGTVSNAAVFRIASNGITNSPSTGTVDLGTKVTGVIQGSTTNTGYWSDVDNYAPLTNGTVDLLTVRGPNTTNSSLKVGTLEVQPYSLNNAFLTENCYYNGGWLYRASGKAGMFYFNGNEGDFRFFPSGSAGASLPNSGNSTQVKINSAGTVAIGGTMNAAVGDYSSATLVAWSNGTVTINGQLWQPMTNSIGGTNIYYLGHP